MDDGSASSNGWLGNAPSVQDFNNLRGEYSVGATDARNRIVISGSYELPFGKGKRFGGSMKPLMDTLIGGWQLNAYWTYQTGLPMDIYMTSGTVADGTQRPNLTGDPRSQYSLQQAVSSNGALNYFNVGAFSNPGDQVDGTSPRFINALRGDSLRDLDFSIFKNFTFRERFKLQLRGEFFNFTNTPRFVDPDSGFGDTNFGVFSSQANQPRQAQIGAHFTF